MRLRGLLFSLVLSVFAAEPIKLDNLLTVLQRKNVPTARLLQIVEESGIDFKATDEELARLKAAGAAPVLLDLVRKKAAEKEPHVVIEAPKPKMAGPLALSCAPAECEISLNGKPAGKTTNGKLVIAEVNPGNYAIDFVRSGYMSEQVMVKAEIDQPVSQTVRLKATPETLRAEGPKLFEKVLAKYGGEKAVQEAAAVETSGELTLLGAGGKRSVFELDALQKAPLWIRMRIESAKLDWTSAFKGRDSIKSGGKLKDTAVVMDFEKFVREFRDYAPLSLLASIVNDKLRLESDPSPNDDKTRVLRAVSGTGALSLTVDEEGLIIKAAAESQGLGAAAVEALYGQYEEVASTPYPKNVVIRHSATEGAEFKFAGFKPAAKATERDFRR